MSIPRLADAARRLNECRSIVTQMRQSVGWMSQTRLTAVVGEQGLIESLTNIIARADEQINQMANGTSDKLNVCMAELESLLDGPVWTVARQTHQQIAERYAEVETQVRAVTEEYLTLRTNFEKLDVIVKRAENLHFEGAESAKNLAKAFGRLRKSQTDFQAGRFDTAAAAVEYAKSLLTEAQLTSEFSAGQVMVDVQKFGSYVEKLAKDLDDAEEKDDKLARRIELFLISGMPAEDKYVPYTVLLRRPGYGHMPETNLYDVDVETLDIDQTLFKEIINEIAATALEGIRSAPKPTGEATDEAGTVRRALPERKVLAKHLDQLDPAERLERIGSRMYSLLIPDAMQRLIDETVDFPLTVTSNNPELPWELLHDGSDFLCLKRMFARLPAGQTFPRRTRELNPKRGVEKSRVLLIHSVCGEPLKQAEIEIGEIQNRLAEMTPEPVVTTLLGPDVNSSRLTDELSLGNYDLIHYAGHAGYDPKQPQLSYLLLSSGERFRANRVQRVLEGHPVVFLNACESSKSAPNSIEQFTDSTVAQAQGLASAFVYGGAQACVGSLWPVFDDTAAELSVAFYRQLIVERRRVGEALRLARKSSYDNDTQQDRITWAAYALYGDPSYRLGAETITEYGAG